MDHDSWDIISDALRILSPVLGTWAIYLLNQILSQLRALNGRVTKIEDWHESHDALDNTRFGDLQRQIDAQAAISWHRDR